MSYYADLQQKIEILRMNAVAWQWPRKRVRDEFELLLFDQSLSGRIDPVYACAPVTPISLELKFTMIDTYWSHIEVIVLQYLQRISAVDNNPVIVDHADAYDRAMRGI